MPSSDIEIARRATMQPITDVAAKLNSKDSAPSDWQQAHRAFANRQEILLKKARSNVDA